MEECRNSRGGRDHRPSSEPTYCEPCVRDLPCVQKGDFSNLRVSKLCITTHSLFDGAAAENLTGDQRHGEHVPEHEWELWRENEWALASEHALFRARELALGGARGRISVRVWDHRCHCRCLPCLVIELVDQLAFEPEYVPVWKASWGAEVDRCCCCRCRRSNGENWSRGLFQRHFPAL
jgi:hypothetical protein